MVRPAFRGQANADWRVLSGAVRRLTQAREESFLAQPLALLKLVEDYHANLLRDHATIAGSFGGSDIQRLSELQHLGAATGLLDFTENPLVALWFACQQHPGADTSDGSVFAIDIGNPQVVVNGRTLRNPLDTAELGERVCSYLPDRSLGTRVVAQQSVFLIGHPLIPENAMGRIDVPAAVKKHVLVHAERMGVTQRALFADVPGLATMNAPNVPLPKPMPHAPLALSDGHQAFQGARYEDALEIYREYTATHPDAAEGYCLMGDTYAALRRFSEAADAYASALKRWDVLNAPLVPGDATTRPPDDTGRPVSRWMHFNMGNALAAVGDHGKAVRAYDAALGRTRTRSIDYGRIRYNRANSLFELARYATAIEDYEASMTAVDPSRALLGIGNCRILLGEFAEAIDCFEQAALHDESPTANAFNLIQARSLREELHGRDYTSAQDGRNLSLLVKGWQGVPTMVGFSGYRGNVGNSPSTLRGAPDGADYGDGDLFLVTLTAPP